MGQKVGLWKEPGWKRWCSAGYVDMGTDSAGYLNSPTGQGTRVPGCEPQKNKWYELVREDTEMEKNG